VRRATNPRPPGQAIMVTMTSSSDQAEVDWELLSDGTLAREPRDPWGGNRGAAWARRSILAALCRGQGSAAAGAWGLSWDPGG